MPRTAGGLAPRPTHFPARAQRVIFLCMEDGPSHVDLFDYKPALHRKTGEAMTTGAEKHPDNPPQAYKTRE